MKMVIFHSYVSLPESYFSIAGLAKNRPKKSSHLAQAGGASQGGQEFILTQRNDGIRLFCLDTRGKSMGKPWENDGKLEEIQ
jgi:hypothetical protein